MFKNACCILKLLNTITFLNLNSIFKFNIYLSLLTYLANIYPETMTEYIIRVDLFEVDGKLKVNEFESFDADFLMTLSGSKRKFKEEVSGSLREWSDDRSKAFILDFWTEKIMTLIKKWMNNRAG